MGLLIATRSFAVNPRDDERFQWRLQAWMNIIESQASWQRMHEVILSSSPEELAKMFHSAAESDRAVIAWWLAFARFLPADDQRSLYQNPALIRSHLLLWPSNQSPFWWLIGTFFMALAGFLLILRWYRAGLRPIDPMAETLEDVDPIDLDSQAITISNPGLETDDQTATQDSVTRF